LALTVCVCAGGKITIQNGHFSISTGDMVMWYLEEEVEAGMFDEDGLRIRRSAGQNVQPVDLSVNPIPRDMKKVRDQVTVLHHPHHHVRSSDDVVRVCSPTRSARS